METARLTGTDASTLAVIRLVVASVYLRAARDYTHGCRVVSTFPAHGERAEGVRTVCCVSTATGSSGAQWPNVVAHTCGRHVERTPYPRAHTSTASLQGRRTR